MITPVADVRRGLPFALLVAGTTWFTMVSWRSFADQWGAYLGPLLVVAVGCAFSGAILRATPLADRARLRLHVLVVALVVWMTLGGSPLHPVWSTHHIADTIQSAWLSATTLPAPIPATAPSIAPLMILVGALALLCCDLLACWGRRVAVAGLTLVAVYAVPISVQGGDVAWEIFLGSAAGFLLMLFFQQSAQVARWGRPLGTASADPDGYSVNAGASRATATTVGAVALVLAVILPMFIPTIHLHSPDLFGVSGGSTVKVDDPVVDMRRNLLRGKNVRLLDIHTDDPDPSYLRIAVLTEFDGVKWGTGDRSVVPGQTADGALPIPEQYLRGQSRADTYSYMVTATKYFDSRWLPTEFPVSSVSAPGTWNYDVDTMDFFSGSDTTTRGLTYQMTAVKSRPSVRSMVRSQTAPPQIQSTYTDLPDAISPLAHTLALRVTAGATSQFQAMEMLQDWFRSKFHYNLTPATMSQGDGNDALDQFLTRKGGRVGACQQFAAAFAVMARTLEIPARVALGFLQPTRVRRSTDEWRYRAWDMHAWPEVFFRGSGWVRFEPTPASRARSVPGYTIRSIPSDRGSGRGQTTQIHGSRPSASASSRPGNTTRLEDSSASSGSRLPWTEIALTTGLLVLVGALLRAPGAVRRRRRTRRLVGGAEDAWAELRDTAIDLGLSWPRGRSPHETGRLLADWFGSEHAGAPSLRPPRGHGLAPAAEAALGRIVLLVEQVRYARYADDVPGVLRDDLTTCIAALERGSTSRELSRARWYPRSLLPGVSDSRVAQSHHEPEVVSRSRPSA